jgi:hypothetical protein
MLGRPIYHMTGNIINAGRTVNLAHSHGLHRDPSAWRAGDSEKSLRARVWWALVVHDHWYAVVLEPIAPYPIADPCSGPVCLMAHLPIFRVKTMMSPYHA